MFISLVTKYRKDATTGVISAYTYYRLSTAYRIGNVKRNRVVIGLGELDGLTQKQRNQLADMLTMMIEKGETMICEVGCSICCDRV